MLWTCSNVSRTGKAHKKSTYKGHDKSIETLLGRLSLQSDVNAAGTGSCMRWGRLRRGSNPLLLSSFKQGFVRLISVVSGTVYLYLNCISSQNSAQPHVQRIPPVALRNYASYPCIIHTFLDK